MKYIGYSRLNRQILSLVESTIRPIDNDEICFIEGDVDTSVVSDKAYIDASGQLAFSEASVTSKIWDGEKHIPNFEVIAKNLVAQVKHLALKKQEESILIGEILLDADFASQSNVKSKIEEIRAREEIELGVDHGNLLWRDANNQTHYWNSVAEYKSWLAIVAVKMVERGTNIYKAAWTHKDRISYLVSSGDTHGLETYDVFAHWPE